MPMSNERWKPNVTVAAVIQDATGRFLLVEEETPEGLMLNNPAGHLDPGESPIEAAIRETLEETAHEFVPEALLGLYLARFQRPARSEDVTYLRLAFSGRVGAPIPGLSLDKGIVRTLWLTADEIRASAARHRSPLLLQCIEDHLAGRRLPLEAVHTDASLYQPVIKGP
jgi:8-oxo-dGTP pyrophosphatase MutT (NUDIX family)